MHVLIITQYFPPEIGAAASRWGDFTKILSEQNHEVTILCESPHYPNSTYYSGYNNHWVSIERKHENFTIVRTKAYASDRKSFIKKLAHYFVFMFSAITNIKKIKNFDLLIISSPPLFTGVIGLFIKKFYKKEFWLDIRDLWPDSVLALNQLKKGRVFKYGKNLEKIIYKNAKGFIFPVPAFRDYLSKFSPDISEKPMIDLMNGVSKNFILDAKSFNAKDKKFTVLYSGNIGLAQDLKTIIEAASLLSKYDIFFEIIGQGVCKSEIVTLAENQDIKIRFHDSKPRKELIKAIMKSSVCLVPLKNKEIFKLALPSKMFEYMACEKPVIVGVDGEAKKLLKKSKSGIFVQPENPEMLSKAILTYYSDSEKLLEHGKNGLRYITQNLVKEVLVSNLIEEVKKQA
tara:strand:+ start:750 stop:1952 length:1203 start_codon:yes stop_codon:yes gene_type:complete